ncbi:DUF397 domain-containing protein [Actinomadura sp. WMMB 499]|uniref:DUF397 domain-containing protein n=1 Tax=Actinomadura sp. WMMB 499 TaxID=1219491 RepID=UPI001244CB60|nr:DUF397 domain-containing protein [Actinomadura sp. WMMB 499]QFG20985.1 DUF397 domain-containing protein [Actinomadura sp. WMMB 499]
MSPSSALTPHAWRRSSHSAQGANCVEIADGYGRRAVRDSKDPHGSMLTVTPHAWSSLLARIKQGHHDLH